MRETLLPKDRSRMNVPNEPRVPLDEPLLEDARSKEELGMAVDALNRDFPEPLPDEARSKEGGIGPRCQAPTTAGTTTGTATDRVQTGTAAPQLQQVLSVTRVACEGRVRAPHILDVHACPRVL